MLIMHVFSALWLIASAGARLTKADCDQTGACIQKSAKHRGDQLYCLHPDRDTPTPPPCTDQRLARIRQIHVHGTHEAASCGYYDLDTAAYLGPAHSYSVRRNHTPVGLCLTGQMSSVKFYTTCRESRLDDSFSSPEALETRCDEVHESGERVLSDRCVVNPPVDIFYWLLTAATLLGVPLALLHYAVIISLVSRWVNLRAVGPQNEQTADSSELLANSEANQHVKSPLSSYPRTHTNALTPIDFNVQGPSLSSIDHSQPSSPASRYGVLNVVDSNIKGTILGLGAEHSRDNDTAATSPASAPEPPHESKPSLTPDPVSGDAAAHQL